MNIKDAVRESSTRAGYNPNIAADTIGQIVYETAFITGAEWERQKAIEAFKFVTDGYFIVGGTDYSESRLKEFIEKLNS